VGRKKGKKNKHKPAHALTDFRQLERQAEEAFAAGKFRKARDAFKVLSKKDSNVFLPKLIEANLGLFNDMLSKGLNSEAEQLLLYLEGIAPKEKLTGLKEAIAASAGDWNTVGRFALQSLENNLDALPEQRIMALTDQAMLSFESFESDSQVSRELRATQHALQACSESGKTVKKGVENFKDGGGIFLEPMV